MSKEEYICPKCQEPLLFIFTPQYHNEYINCYFKCPKCGWESEEVDMTHLSTEMEILYNNSVRKEALNSPWKDIDKEKPAPGQVVLVLAYPHNPVIMMAYTIEHRKKLEFGIATSSEYTEEKALQSYPITDKVFAWMPLPQIPEPKQ